MIIAIVVAAVVIIGGGVTAIVLLTGDDNPTPTGITDAGTAAPPETTENTLPSETDSSETDTGGGGGSGDLPEAASPEGLRRRPGTRRPGPGLLRR